MNRATVFGFELTGLFLLATLAGCPLTGTVDGIGATCTPAGDAPCPLDHVCIPDADDATTGLCAPVIDYGSCDAPTWPQRTTKTRDEGIDIDIVDEYAFLTDVTRIVGDFGLVPETAGTTAQLGDLCPLAGLQQVTGSVLVKATDLATLDGLQSLSAVGNGVGIASNRNLVNLKGLYNLFSVDRPDDNFSIVLADNLALSNEEVVALRTRLKEINPTAEQRLVVCGSPLVDVTNGDPECPVSVNELLRR
jgi:hypothetical protein